MGSRKSFKAWNPHQPFLLPPSPADWLPEGHLANFVLDVVGQLDLSGFEEAVHGKDPRGVQPYAPEMMVALLLYGYATGVFSSRKLERATWEDVAFRVLAGGHHPHFTTINGFRRQHLERFKALFLQVLRLCQAAGLVKLGHVALDGTKVQGNASKHKAMSYERMLKSELELADEIEKLLAQAAEVDGQEDTKLGKGQRDEDLPEEIRRREDRLATIRAAKVRLEAEAATARSRELREQAERASTRAATSDDPVERKRATTVAAKKRAQARAIDPDHDDDDHDPPRTVDGLPKHEPPAATDGKPSPRAQMNFTDADSRIMESGGSYLQGYNCQAAVDDGRQIIVAQAVTNLAPDAGCFVPMLDGVVANCGASPATMTADAGYWTPAAPAAAENHGTDAHISTSRRAEKLEGEHAVADAPSTTPERDAMREKLQTEKGRSVYARRKAVVEPVFGQIKEARGFRRFLLRGLGAVQAEWAMLCTTHNLLKLWRATLAAQAVAPA